MNANANAMNANANAMGSVIKLYLVIL